MSRFIRHVFNAVLTLSLLFCAITLILWIRSYWVRDFFHYYREIETRTGYVNPQWDACSCGGGLSLHHADARLDLPNHQPEGPVLVELARELSWKREWRQPGEYATADVMPQDGYQQVFNGWRWRWRSFVVMRLGYPQWSTFVAVPYWFLMALLAIVPAIWVVRPGRRRRPGLCARCGYDLRATPDRCPECGGVPAKANA